ncbi:MAG: PmoA family protein [Phycisphaerae bacterium]|nr:PmoA family protein [Phycisphaerae bacterium]
MKLMKKFVIEIVAFLVMISPSLVNAEDGESGRELKKTVFSWKETDDAVALLNHDKVVWQLNYKKEEAKPYLHPVATINGEVLTSLRPKDHPWH